jgi:hypothetical protein
VASDYGVQAQVFADFDTPDRVLYGLTARQVAILAATGALLWAAYHALTPMVPAVVFGIAAIPLGGLAAALALGRRDGISMDRWIAAAVKASRSPRRLVAASGGIVAVPGWAPAVHTEEANGARRAKARAKATATAVAPTVAPLRLPAQRIDDSGVVDIEDGRVALTAATTVNFDLRTVDEQYALVDAMGRWLNSLSGPVQIVVSTRRVNMHAYADQIDNRLHMLPDPALADAAAGYAQFLRELADDRDPLDRHVLIAHHVGAHTDPAVAQRAAEQTARALTGLGAATEALDGGQVTDALAAGCDPWRHTGIGRATPGAVITGLPDGSLS